MRHDPDGERKTMAVSKRLCFEILKRDNHTCRCCGASAPEVKLDPGGLPDGS